MSSEREIYVVYLYCDYRKEVDLQHLKGFTDRDEAIAFAKKYSAPEDENTETEYVCIKGTEYDSVFYYPGDESSSDEENPESGEKSPEEHVEEESRNQKYKRMREELKVKPGMWYTRIAVDQMPLVESKLSVSAPFSRDVTGARSWNVPTSPEST